MRRTSRLRGSLYGHNLLLLCSKVFVHLSDMFVGDVLDLFLGIFCLILTETVLLEFLDLFDSLAANTADGNPGLFAFARCPADELFSSFFRERWHEKPDDVAVILGSNPQIGVDD